MKDNRRNIKCSECGGEGWREVEIIELTAGGSRTKEIFRLCINCGGFGAFTKEEHEERIAREVTRTISRSVKHHG